MSMRSNTPSNGANNEDGIFLSNELIHEIWVKLVGRVTREHIRQIATEVASEYKDAKVTTFLPILIRRQMLERLASSGREEE